MKEKIPTQQFPGLTVGPDFYSDGADAYYMAWYSDEGRLKATELAEALGVDHCELLSVQKGRVDSGFGMFFGRWLAATFGTYENGGLSLLYCEERRAA
jgi:hypothetical protein